MFSLRLFCVTRTHVLHLILHWRLQVRVAMGVAAMAACVAGGLFLALREPLQHVMHLSREVLLYARPYWLLRAGCVPLQLWVSGMSGILQGYSRVALNAGLFVSALLDTCMSPLLRFCL